MLNVGLMRLNDKQAPSCQVKDLHNTSVKFETRFASLLTADFSILLYISVNELFVFPLKCSTAVDALFTRTNVLLILTPVNYR